MSVLGVPPSLGNLRLDVDASFDNMSRCYGTGCVVRDKW